jgi:hypothetical protein
MNSLVGPVLNSLAQEGLFGEGQVPVNSVPVHMESAAKGNLVKWTRTPRIRVSSSSPDKSKSRTRSPRFSLWDRA